MQNDVLVKSIDDLASKINTQTVYSNNNTADLLASASNIIGALASNEAAMRDMIQVLLEQNALLKQQLGIESAQVKR